MTPTSPDPADAEGRILAIRTEALKKAIGDLDAGIVGRLTLRGLSEPTCWQHPTVVGSDTWVVHEVQHALGQPLSVYVNSAVIRSRQPVLVETGSNRSQQVWFDDTFSLVDPADVRWVFLSHEDGDHAGKLGVVMDACPNATLVGSSALAGFAAVLGLPRQRCRWVGYGETFDARDRQMAIVRPPVRDHRGTLGLLDTKTGVYWAADAFATPVPGGQGAGDNTIARNVADLDDRFWSHGMTTFALNGISPEIHMVDKGRFREEVEQLSGLEITAIVAGHSPVITGSKIADALATLRGIPISECPPASDRVALDLLLAIHRGP